MIEVDSPQERRQQPLSVNVNMGFKRNMGNYESMNISVGLSAPALRGESATEAFNRVYQFVEDRLMEKFAETEEALKEAGLGESS